jgi:hypothetical protein
MIGLPHYLPHYITNQSDGTKYKDNQSHKTLSEPTKPRQSFLLFLFLQSKKANSWSNHANCTLMYDINHL